MELYEQRRDRLTRITNLLKNPVVDVGEILKLEGVRNSLVKIIKECKTRMDGDAILSDLKICVQVLELQELLDPVIGCAANDDPEIRKLVLTDSRFVEMLSDKKYTNYIVDGQVNYKKGKDVIERTSDGSLPDLVSENQSSDMKEVDHMDTRESVELDSVTVASRIEKLNGESSLIDEVEKSDIRNSMNRFVNSKGNDGDYYEIMDKIPDIDKVDLPWKYYDHHKVKEGLYTYYPGLRRGCDDSWYGIYSDVSKNLGRNFFLQRRFLSFLNSIDNDEKKNFLIVNPTENNVCTYLLMGFDVVCETSVRGFVFNLEINNPSSKWYKKHEKKGFDMLAMGKIRDKILYSDVCVFDIFGYMGENFDKSYREGEYNDRSSYVDLLENQGIRCIYPKYGTFSGLDVSVSYGFGAVFPLNFHKPMFLFIDQDLQVKMPKTWNNIISKTVEVRDGILVNFGKIKYSLFMLISNCFRNYRIVFVDSGSLDSAFVSFLKVMDDKLKCYSNAGKRMLNSLIEFSDELFNRHPDRWSKFFDVSVDDMPDVSKYISGSTKKFKNDLSYVDAHPIILADESPVTRRLKDTPLLGLVDNINHKLVFQRGQRFLVSLEDVKCKRNKRGEKREDLKDSGGYSEVDENTEEDDAKVRQYRKNAIRQKRKKGHISKTGDESISIRSVSNTFGVKDKIYENFRNGKLGNGLSRERIEDENSTKTGTEEGKVKNESSVDYVKRRNNGRFGRNPKFYVVKEKVETRIEIEDGIRTSFLGMVDSKNSVSQYMRKEMVETYSDNFSNYQFIKDKID